MNAQMAIAQARVGSLEGLQYRQGIVVPGQGVARSSQLALVVPQDAAAQP